MAELIIVKTKQVPHRVCPIDGRASDNPAANGWLPVGSPVVCSQKCWELYSRHREHLEYLDFGDEEKRHG